MDIQDLDAKIISITQVRRDIDVLNRILEKEKEAIIMKNQKVMYIVRKPEMPKQKKTAIREKTIDEAMKVMASLRAKHKFTKEVASSYVIKMRDERAKKWKR